jgi:isopentenyl phosphate kinase
MLVTIKLGGSIITDKAHFKTPNKENIDKLCSILGKKYKKGIKFIVIHGAGSYAHIPSKEYDLANGIKNEEGKLNFSKVHLYCDELSNLIIESLIKHGMPAVSFHPATFVIQKNKEPLEIYDKMILRYLNLNYVPVSHGDVVLDENINTSIISGDALMDHFGKISDKLIFVSDVDGLLTSLDGNGKVIDIVNEENINEVLKLVSGSSHTDVTGGMGGKIKNLSKLKCETYIVNGNFPERVEKIINNEKDVYTKFIFK